MLVLNPSPSCRDSQLLVINPVCVDECAIQGLLEHGTISRVMVTHPDQEVAAIAYARRFGVVIHSMLPLPLAESLGVEVQSKFYMHD
ncbi:hypothetical protein KIPB_017141, partial [Kipferlia bialata]|eukprot:g17141.t1